MLIFYSPAFLILPSRHTPYLQPSKPHHRGSALDSMLTCVCEKRERGCVCERQSVCGPQDPITLVSTLNTGRWVHIYLVIFAEKGSPDLKPGLGETRPNSSTNKEPPLQSPSEEWGSSKSPNLLLPRREFMRPLGLPWWSSG